MTSDAQEKSEDLQKEAPVKTRGQKVSILGEFFVFLRENKRWWLIPIITIFLLLGALIAISSQTAWAPFIYTLF
jgi:hypothetical protein